MVKLESQSVLGKDRLWPRIRWGLCVLLGHYGPACAPGRTTCATFQVTGPLVLSDIRALWNMSSMLWEMSSVGLRGIVGLGRHGVPAPPALVLGMVGASERACGPSRRPRSGHGREILEVGGRGLLG